MQVDIKYRDIFRIAVPVIISSVAMTVLNITDTAFLGRVGEVELGASAVGGVLYFAFAMMGLSIGTGAQIMISRRTGEKRDEAVGEIFDHSIIILLVLSLFLFVVMKFISPPLLKLILNSEKLITATISFLDYRSYGLIFVMLGSAFRSFYVGISAPKIFGVYSFLMAVINIVLGYVLIFGNWGAPNMGIAGAGLASSVSEFLSLIFLVGYTYFKKSFVKYNLFRFIDLSKEMIRQILDLSLPLVMQNLLSIGSWFIFFIFIEKFGQHELAISNIVRGAYMICMTPVWGFSVAANSMISNIIGQGRENEVMVLLNRVMKLTILVSACMVLITFFFPVQVLQLFTNDRQLINDSIACLRIVDLAMFFFSFAIVAISGVSGTGATRVALYIEIAAITLYMLYNYIFTYVWRINIEILWLSEVIYWLFTGWVSFWFVKSMKWKKIKV